MKKLLIIIEKCMAIEPTRNALINEFVNERKNQGYQIDIIGDSSGIMRDLLEENEVRSKEITSAQADVLFDLNRYEHAIYVPKTAQANQDILVYDPEKLDKNMIFYNIGNLNIASRKALEKTREDNLEHLKGFTTEKGDYTDNIEKSYTSQGVIGDEYDKSKAELVDELTEVFNETEPEVLEKMTEAERKKAEELKMKAQAESKPADYKNDNWGIHPSSKAVEQSREENRENLRGFTTEEGDYTDNIEKSYTSQGVIGDEYDKSKAELVEEMKDIFNKSEEEVESEMKAASKGSVGSIPKISLDEKITIGEITDKKKITL